MMQNNNYTETQEFLVAILDAVPFGIVAIDLKGYVIMCNEEVLVELNIEKKVKEVIETHFYDYLENIPSLKEILETQLAKESKSFDLTSVHFFERLLTIRGRSILNGMIITIEDVTKAREQERTNLNAMLEGQETERRRLSREIHDGIGPVMSTIKLHLDAVKSELNEVPEKTLKKINSMSELINDIADDIRSISHALMPGALVDLGLVSALENLCQRANESEKVQVNFYHSGMEKRLDIKLALGLFRISQELLNNAFKYAQATTINVQLIRYPESILLMVEDDGIGFDKTKIKALINNGIGLRNIQTRSRALGGRFNIDTQKGRGVLATIEIPLNN